MDGIELVDTGKLTLVCRVSPVMFDVLTSKKYIIREILMQIPYSLSLHKVLYDIIREYNAEHLINLRIVDDGGREFLLPTPVAGMSNTINICLSGPRNIVLSVLRKNPFFCNECPGFTSGNNYLRGSHCTDCKTKHKHLSEEYKKYRNKQHFHIRYSRDFIHRRYEV